MYHINYQSFLIMKNLLLIFTSVLLSFTGAGATASRQDLTASRRSLQLTRVNPPIKTQEMKRNPMVGTKILPLNASAGNKPYYKRPAGAFYSPFIAVDGCGLYTYGDYNYLLVTPYGDYTYSAEAVGNYYFYWLVDETPDAINIDESRKHTVHYDMMEQEPPKLCFSLERDESEITDFFQYPAYYGRLTGGADWWDPMGDDNPAFYDDGSHVLVVPSVNSDMFEEENTEFLLSSKTMTYDVSSNSMMTSFYGAEPYGSNKYGWFFGKNGEHIDGMAQAFEKPTHPYLLKKVFLQTEIDLRVKEDVTMTCRVYKLDRIPSFVAGDCAVLPEVPGELVVFGEALVTPQTAEEKNGLIEFTLYDADDDDPTLTYEYTPMIDFPILVCIDGYNDPGMESLEEFSAFVSTNWNDDEGYGELAYLKSPIYEVELDDNGDTLRDSRGYPITSFKGNYNWCGLNNFFSSPMEMKTGLTVFIATERPYLFFNNPYETGEYKFERGGGDCNIEFYSWLPSHDGDWTMLWNGAERLPDWLHIELIDGEEDGQFNNIVTAHVTADPQGYKNREAVIRFAIPGTYLDYKFIQRKNEMPCPPVDGEYTIALINYTIYLILNDMYDNCYDFNMDGELDISDVNVVIDIILSN